MDVIKSNFLDCLPAVQKAIKEASFFAIDGEFSGVGTNNITAFDTPEEYFYKTYDSSNGFILIQLGLTTFKLLQNDKFDYKTFNFYVYPKSKQVVFKCQGQSLSFLSHHGFDFNLLFREGINCTTINEAEKLKEIMLEKQKQRSIKLKLIENNEPPNISNHITVKDEDQIWLTDIQTDIENYVKSDATEGLVLENKNGFQRKLIYQLVEAKFYRDVSVGMRPADNKFVIERKKSFDEEKQMELERIEKEERELEEMIGISSVLRLVSETGKLIVGHNMLLDVLYILRQCFGDVPRDFRKFKHYANSIFPNLIDTKYLCSHDKLKPYICSSILNDVYDTVHKGPFKLPEFETEPPFGFGVNDHKEHNAGFDSYITGLVFTALTNFLSIKPNDLNGNCKILANKKNRLFCVRLQDVFYINMLGNEPIPVRDHAFYMTFSPKWTLSDITNHFREFGSIAVFWINETSAFISLHNKNNAKDLVKKIGYIEDVKIMSYEEYRNSIKPDSSTSHTAIISPKMKWEASPLTNSTTPTSHRKRKHLTDSSKSNPPLKKSFKDTDIWE